jgi:hypothetical protein
MFIVTMTYNPHNRSLTLATCLPAFNDLESFASGKKPLNFLTCRLCSKKSTLEALYSFLSALLIALAFRLIATAFLASEARII